MKLLLTDDGKILELLKALEKRDKEVEAAYVKELADKGWVIADLNSQLCQILCDCAVPKSAAQQKLLALEGREEIRGLYARADRLDGVEQTSSGRPRTKSTKGLECRGLGRRDHPTGGI